MGKWTMGRDEKRADGALQRHNDRMESRGVKGQTRVGQKLQDRADDARREGR